MNGRGKSDSLIVPKKLLNEGSSALQGTGQGESEPTNQVPDTGPGRLATCVGTDTAGSA